MIAYRLATQEDAPVVLRLLEEIMVTHGVNPPARDRLAPVVSSIIAAKDHCFLLAETDEQPGAGGGPGGAAAGAPGGVVVPDGAAPRVVGMCSLIYTMSTWSAAPVCELQDVIVTRDYRRAGVGRGLIAEAERLARGRGCARLFLLAEYWNLGAQAFYRRLGLSEDTNIDFERDLTGGAKTPST
jgi:GNAT superfamily N-acetyltransferase